MWLPDKQTNNTGCCRCVCSWLVGFETIQDWTSIHPEWAGVHLLCPPLLINAELVYPTPHRVQKERRSHKFTRHRFPECRPEQTSCASERSSQFPLFQKQPHPCELALVSWFFFSFLRCWLIVSETPYLPQESSSRRRQETLGQHTTGSWAL